MKIRKRQEKCKLAPAPCLALWWQRCHRHYKPDASAGGNKNESLHHQPLIATFYHVFLLSPYFSFTFALVHPTLPPKTPIHILLFFRQVPVSVCEHVFMCVWWEGFLLKEVASHKSQLMSITLLPERHSSPCTRAHSPTALHARGPQEHRARSHTHTHLQRWTVTHSRHPTQMPEWAPRCRINTYIYTLLHTGILNRNPGIGCFSHLTHYKHALEPFFSPHKQISIASTSKYSFRVSDTQQEEVSYSFLLSPSAVNLSDTLVPQPTIIQKDCSNTRDTMEKRCQSRRRLSVGWLDAGKIWEYPVAVIVSGSSKTWILAVILIK